MKDFDILGREQKKFAPKPGRLHPNDSSFAQRRGIAKRDDDGRVVGRIGEQVIKVRHTTLHARSKLAASASIKMAHFVRSQAETDYRLDCPAVAECPNPGKAPFGGCVDSRRRLKRSR